MRMPKPWNRPPSPIGLVLTKSGLVDSPERRAAKATAIIPGCGRSIPAALTLMPHAGGDRRAQILLDCGLYDPAEKSTST